MQPIILLVFFASGAAGLVYEVVWTRALSLVFGVTTYAVATVLATFMGGLALGSAVFGRWGDRQRNPLLAYAILEAGIGLYALVVPTLFHALRTPYVWIHQLALPYAALAFARALLAGMVLAVPTTLMGGTYPILVRFLTRGREDVARAAGLLYFVNTAGALAGCVLAGFYLIARLGLAGATLVAASLNFAAAAAAGVLAWTATVPATPRTSAEGDGEAAACGVPPNATFVLACIGISGFTSLAYEVLWTRALLRYLYNSTYAFTTMLATFLAGIAVGSALYTAFLRHRRRPLAVFAALEAFVGAGFLVSSLLFAHLHTASVSIVGPIIASFGQSVLVMFLQAACILLLPAVFLGATVPLATAVCARSLATLGATVGRVYAVNTFGAIAGSLGAAFLLIPTLGMQGTLTLLIGLNFALAWVLHLADGSAPRRVLTAPVLAAALIGILFLIPPDLFRHTFAPPPGALVFYREGATDTVGVVELDGQRTIVYEDRRGTAGTTTYPWNFFAGHLPMLLHPGEPRRVLHICFGVGNSLSAVEKHDTVERIDNVELSPHVLEAARYFWTNDDVLSSPRVHTIIDDGRNFVMATGEVYDVIQMEPPEVFTAGVINLYTREFYRDVADRLAPEGIFMQWLPVGEAPIEEERMLFRAFGDVFPDATAWQQHGLGPLLLIGTKGPFRIDYRLLQEKMARGAVHRDLTLIRILDADDLLARLVFDPPAFRDFALPAPPVTEDRTVLDFSMPHYLGSGFGLGTFNPSAQEHGRNATHVALERALFYESQRRSVVKLLTNVGDERPETIEARIGERRRTRSTPGPIAAADWRR